MNVGNSKLTFSAVLHVGIAVCLSLATALCAHAQDITGSLYGIVHDQTGAAIANAKITATLTTRGLIRTATSNGQGEYLFSQLPVGAYRITIVAKTFKTEAHDDIAVDAAQSTHHDIQMTPGDVTATVTVNAEAEEGVDTRSATIGTLIDSTSLHELPIDGDNVVSLAALLPGVTSVTAPPSFTGDHSGPTFSASGSRLGQNLFLFDGVLYNNLYRNTGLNYPPRDALQEVQVLTNNYSAEYGRNAGSIFQVVTKSGSNRYHGSLWETAKNTAFNASNYSQQKILPLIQNQFGGTVGGPIWKNKLFFMASYQGYRYVSSATSGAPAYTSGTPSQGSPAQFINANTDAMFYSGTPIYDPIDPCANSKGCTFKSNTIPHTLFDPTAVAIINAFGLSTSSGALNSIVLKIPQNNDLGLIRADYNAGKHTVDFRYYVLDSDAIAGTGNVFAYDPQYTQANSMLSSATDTMILSPHLINVSHAGYKRFTAYILPEDPRSLSTFGSNFPALGPPTLPEIIISSEFTLSSANNVYNKFINQNAELNDSLTWEHGAHEIKTGVTYLHLAFLERSWNQSQGVFNFSGQRTSSPVTLTPGSGNSLADFLLGLPIQLTVTTPEIELSAIQNEIFGYVQDQWRIRPNLTLNLGIRYELPFPWREQKNHTSTFIAGQQSTVFPGAPAGMVYFGDQGIPRGMVSTDANNFAPRFGFAWSPLKSGKLSVRGGYGIAFDAINADVIFLNQPFVYTFNIPSPYSLSDPLKGQPALPTSVNLTNPQFVGLPNGSFDDRNMRSPYVHQMNLGVQIELPKRVIVAGNYVAKLGHKLVLPYTFNPALYAPGATNANQDSRRRIPGFGDLEDFSTLGWSNYHALQLGVTRRAKNLTVNGNYTWSRSLDVGSSYNSEGGYLPFPFELRKNYGPSDFNAAHNMSFSYVLHLPALSRRNYYLREVLGGWTYSGIYSARTGSPVNVVVGYDQAYSTTPNQPPVVTGNWRLPSNRHRKDKMAEYFNRTAFTAPPVGAYGNASRNLIVGPAAINNSMAISKSFVLPKMRSGTHLDFRCDAFGVFNTPNIGNFNSNNLQIGSTMGTIYSSYGERTLQLSLHLFY
ncbi:MAG: carboxypeptidase regulatory-like domain-containing protein [Acidobacteriaceae bacterium]|nr:carboxypeptidase regulatory-like domain-containing protein [Acidobacteriaceae bacterium]